MNLERRLQIAVVILAGCGALILGFTKGDLRLPLLALAVAATGFVLTDLKGWFYLSSSAANLAGVLATIYALRNLFPNFDDRQALFLSLSDLLVYLQAVLFLREKVPRIYGMISLLSFLQVAVAAVISVSAWFGVLMVVYLFIAVYTLSLFLLYREEYEHKPLFWGKAVGPLPSRPRWPLLYQPLVLQPRHCRTSLRLRGLGTQVWRTGFIALLLAPLVFLVIPRFSTRGGSWTSSSGLQATVAFTEDVSLVGDQFSNVLQDPEEVMRVRFHDVRTMQPYAILDRDNIYFRGSSRNVYYRNGMWSGETESVLDNSEPISPFELAQVSSTNDLVAVETTVEPLPTHNPSLKISEVLFAIYPFFGLESETQVNFDPRAERLYSQEVFRSARFTYQHITTGLKNGRQLPFRWITQTRIQPSDRSALLSLPVEVGNDPLAGLKQVAAQVVAELPPDQQSDPVMRARALESHLRDSGIYRYSLGGGKPQAQLDPAEDFIVHSKSGHCEFFATVLTLMLRSQGIPARVVTGYRGGEWDPETGECLVRQWHAHAWVEALIPPEYLPPEFQPRPDRAWIPAEDRSRRTNPEQRRFPRQRWIENYGLRSAWMRLDATPGGETRAPTQWAQVRHLGELAEVFWSQYVLGMNPQTQRQHVYSPFASLFDAAAWRAWWNDVQALVAGDLAGYRWISWQAGVVAFGVQLLLVAMYKIIRRRRQRRLQKTPEISKHALPSEVLFYRRLEQILSDANLRRSRVQTQREFAMAVAADLAERPATARYSAIPRKLVDLFYRVRFGCHALSEDTQHEIERDLDELESALQEPEPVSSSMP